jgi:tight adherence protein C
MRALAAGAATSLLAVMAMAPARPGRRRAPLDRPRPGAPRMLAGLGAGARRTGRIQASPLPDAVLGALAVASTALLPLAPPVALLVAAAVWGQARVAAHRARRAADRAVARALPDTVDLFLLCAGAGLSLPLAHPLVAARTPAPLGGALRSAQVATHGGRPRADALLDALAPLGERTTALAHTLVDHLRYGVALAPGLERLSLELRLDRRRRAEEDARRVPVRLLGPLVTCILPAFGLLTVVPLLVASLRALPL